MVTPGGEAVQAAVTPAGDPAAAEAGEVWLRFEVETGVGEGMASLWWSPAAGLARLPLGARAGELELVLSVGDGVSPDQSPLAPLAVESVVRERRAWDEGTFVLRDGAQLDVGQIQLNGADHPAEIGVWDALWLTDAMVVAERGDDGGDLLLGFEAEPSVQGEDALIRLNVVTRRVIVPAGPHPSPDDRWLVAEPGSLDPEAVDAGIQAAIAAADAQELAWLTELAPRLTADAATASGCDSPTVNSEPWTLLLTGYEVGAESVGEGCAVRLEARPRQHRRRFSGWIGARGVLAEAEWPDAPVARGPSSAEN